MPAGYQDDLSVGQLYSFLGCESECIVVRTYDVPLGRRSRSRQHADTPSVPTSKPIAPVDGSARTTYAARSARQASARPPPLDGVPFVG